MGQKLYIVIIVLIFVAVYFSDSIVNLLINEPEVPVVSAEVSKLNTASLQSKVADTDLPSFLGTYSFTLNSSGVAKVLSIAEFQTIEQNINGTLTVDYQVVSTNLAELHITINSIEGSVVYDYTNSSNFNFDSLPAIRLKYLLEMPYGVEKKVWVEKRFEKLTEEERTIVQNLAYSFKGLWNFSKTSGQHLLEDSFGKYVLYCKPVIETMECEYSPPSANKVGESFTYRSGTSFWEYSDLRFNAYRFPVRYVNNEEVRVTHNNDPLFAIGNEWRYLLTEELPKKSSSFLVPKTDWILLPVDMSTFVSIDESLSVNEADLLRDLSKPNFFSTSPLLYAKVVSVNDSLFATVNAFITGYSYSSVEFNNYLSLLFLADTHKTNSVLVSHLRNLPSDQLFTQVAALGSLQNHNSDTVLFLKEKSEEKSDIGNVARRALGAAFDVLVKDERDLLSNSIIEVFKSGVKADILEWLPVWGNAGSSPGLSYVLEFLANENEPQIQAESVLALRKLHFPEVTNALIKMLSSGNMATLMNLYSIFEQRKFTENELLLIWLIIKDESRDRPKSMGESFLRSYLEENSEELKYKEILLENGFVFGQ